ncbi:mannose-1-phosphate guanyltransferase alpha-A-like isoform X2 [Argiope bruennichi]|uniref:mannose-1-phosphate guanyltransferase alpha-A-like isoform X2 n=1 Tax=Argiope bruennichi TaxID=94029 RepID=UPI002493D56B|nr:mannose-1-phosphate guanyltransferase alpha-A-like isoform X2 [Argiope bruennichi]XP_055927035.1 mannose-1-phosphate guanyltransferase alpha-A-like isoform X2 [Argiope bruennichi]
MYKAVILIGGPQKGTRFRPLSFDIPKPLFPVAGVPTIQHLIEACCKVPNLREILLIGFYQVDESINQFVSSMVKEYNINIGYLQEYTALGTAGGIYHFRDQIQSGDPEAFFLINGDVCGDFPLVEMTEFHKENEGWITVLGTEATRQQAQQYGCIVEDKNTHKIVHYVEKPSTFVSQIINCGVYLCSLDIFTFLATVFKRKQQDFYNGYEQSIDITGCAKDCISLEQDIVTPLASKGKVYAFHSTRWWSQIKTAASAIYANRHYLDLYLKTHPNWLAKNVPDGPFIIGNVFIHPSAKVHNTAHLGPNVSIGKNVVIGAGVRIKESIILGNATIHDHTLVLHCIVGWNSTIGAWARIEGTPSDPNPNKPFAKMENVPLFNNTGHLNPSITVLGSNVQVPPEVIILNSIVLPHKELTQSYKNEIIL